MILLLTGVGFGVSWLTAALIAVGSGWDPKTETAWLDELPNENVGAEVGGRFDCASWDGAGRAADADSLVQVG